MCGQKRRPTVAREIDRGSIGGHEGVAPIGGGEEVAGFVPQTRGRDDPKRPPRIGALLEDAPLGLRRERIKDVAVGGELHAAERVSLYLAKIQRPPGVTEVQRMKDPRHVRHQEHLVRVEWADGG